jgi:hypothetical protein
VVLALVRVQGTGFFLDRRVEHQVGMQAQGGRGIAGHGDQGHALALEHRQDRGQFLGLAAVRNRQQQIGCRDHAQVAMAGLGRMDEHGRCAGRGKGGGHLATDVPALAHAHHDHPPRHLEHQRHGPGKRLANVLTQAQHGRGFDLEGLMRKADGPACIQGRWFLRCRSCMDSIGACRLASIRG